MTIGRPKGSRNKATKDIMEMAKPYAPEALKVLASIMQNSESDAARVAAANALVDRAYGRAHQTIASTVEVTRLVARMPEPAKNTDEWLERHAPLPAPTEH